MTQTKFIIPVRYAAWLTGDLGRNLQAWLQESMPSGTTVTRLPRAFLIEGLSEGKLSVVRKAAESLEKQAGKMYPVFHHELGPVWTGTLQSVY